MDRNETIADIVAEIREIKNLDDVCPWWADGGDCARCPLGWDGKNCPFPKLADRIEAAAKRERDIMHDSGKWDAFVQEQAVAAYWRERCHDSEEMANKCGNAAKLRAAVEGIEMLLGAGGDLDRKELAKECARALAAPPRNCDVGTVEEQRARLAAWCKGKNCSDCEFCANWCSIGWENAPIVRDDMREGGDHADI